MSSVAAAGVAITYDFEVEATHTFAANGFLTHNSAIEQDCDVIIGLCRPIALPSVQDQIAQVGASTVPIGGVSHAVTDTLMLLVMIKARDDSCAGRRLAVHLHPTALTMHGIDHHA